ncbi:MAG: Mce family protein, partial [Rhodococcus sp. (in: high G+C Gram-positive bacteria)]
SRSIDALASLMTSAAQPLDTAVADSVAMTDAWIPNTAEFDRTMTVLPQLARSINHLGDYGGWLNLYTCNFTVKVGDSESNIFGAAHTEMCR